MADDTGTSNNAGRCSWCGVAVESGDGYRLTEQPGARAAVFCRLEHLVPWALRGAYWEPASESAPATGELAAACSHCGEPLGELRVDLVRHRGEQTVADAFCSVDHACAWAKAGGRYR